MIEREAFLTEPKQQGFLSQQGEWIWGAQSLKARRLLCEFVFIQLTNEL